MQTSRKVFDSIRTISILSTAMTTAATTPESAGVVLPAARATSSAACTRCRPRISPRNAAAISPPSSTPRSSPSGRIPASTPRACRRSSISIARRSATSSTAWRARAGSGASIDPSDRRIKLLELSPAGQAVLQHVEPGIRRVQDRLLAPLTAAEAKTLMRLLGKMADGGRG